VFFKSPLIISVKFRARRSFQQVKGLKNARSHTEKINRNYKCCYNIYFRSLFRWITWKDLNQLDVDESVNPESPLGLLRGIKYGTESYHDLFKRLCRFEKLKSCPTFSFNEIALVRWIKRIYFIYMYVSQFKKTADKMCAEKSVYSINYEWNSPILTHALQIIRA
jgi:hypothetical protein